MESRRGSQPLLGSVCRESGVVFEIAGARKPEGLLKSVHAKIRRVNVVFMHSFLCAVFKRPHANAPSVVPLSTFLLPRHAVRLPCCWRCHCRFVFADQSQGHGPPGPVPRPGEHAYDKTPFVSWCEHPFSYSIDTTPQWLAEKRRDSGSVFRLFLLEEGPESCSIHV